MENKCRKNDAEKGPSWAITTGEMTVLLTEGREGFLELVAFDLDLEAGVRFLR